MTARIKSLELTRPEVRDHLEWQIRVHATNPDGSEYIAYHWHRRIRKIREIFDFRYGNHEGAADEWANAICDSFPPSDQNAALAVI